jgi:CHAT domain-containing protein
MNEWYVFLCYRQEDGSETAHWLYRTLDGQQLIIAEGASQQVVTLKVYFDAAAPAVSDWQSLHGRKLELTRALLVICTPGAFAQRDSDDWVHKEIDWWLQNRNTAPILIDATRQGKLWVPQQIQKRWPNAQLVRLNLKELRELPEHDREAIFKITRERILEGIKISEQNVRLEDLNKNMARAFVERAERAAADGEEITATILLMHAAAIDSSEDIRDHYLAHMYLQMGDVARAKPHIQRLLVYQQEQARRYLTAPALIDRLVLVSTSRTALDSWLLLTAATAEHAYDAVLGSKGLVGRTSLVERRLWRRVSRDEPQLLTDLQHAYRNISTLHLESMLSDGAARYKAAVADVSRAKMSLTSAAKGHDARYISWLSATSSAIQEQLEPSEVILDFLRYEKRYAVWLLRRSGDPIRVELGPSEPIEREVREFRRVIWNLNSDYLAPGGRLYDLIWKPIESYIDDAGVLYVIPDGDLVDFPFGALPAAGNSAFLSERHNVVYLVSAQQLLPWPDTSTVREGALVVSVSSFPSTSQEGPIQLMDLFGVRAELELRQEISAIYGAAMVLDGESATEAHVRSAVPGVAMVHLATHGISIPATDLRPILLTIHADPVNQIDMLVEGSDPFLKSGLVLSDTIITARDLSVLDLDGVDLAVLSGTPPESVQWAAEGSFGFARALLEAGARNVVVSMGPVEDLAAAKIMLAFYKYLANGYSLPTSLRNAALRLRDELGFDQERPFAHPSYWAQFSIHGPAKLSVRLAPKVPNYFSSQK